MGLFDKIFNGSSEEKEVKNLPWIDLKAVEQLQRIVGKSSEKPQIIFKHSTRCGISRMVKSQFESDYKISEGQADLYYLDLLNYRDISNEIAQKFGVYHESPQLLIIKNGSVAAHDSHGGINDLELSKYI
ncbi:bacillithiol system redox-active protein YtxJ [Aestuariibaculum suncheonense]|uniref:Bacillithiol system redox-active protein YtxJ n=1 Tax=Aestuariibaculum suncheonense TaxID=1028745 RepID=A0A8J6Q725_9FLAO|nr:bacillithiol system redox-active protein YtxJ [Aestuariibaculum suncheonense]MBD0835793.1 bacillithiol system redox-active protein YtxJ [Aestuariibaculum suncheonense]